MNVTVVDRGELDVARRVAADLHAGVSRIEFARPSTTAVAVVEHLAAIRTWPAGGIAFDPTVNLTDAEVDRLRRIEDLLADQAPYQCDPEFGDTGPVPTRYRFSLAMPVETPPTLGERWPELDRPRMDDVGQRRLIAFVLAEHQPLVLDRAATVIADDRLVLSGSLPGTSLQAALARVDATARWTLRAVYGLPRPLPRGPALAELSQAAVTLVPRGWWLTDDRTTVLGDPARPRSLRLP